MSSFVKDLRGGPPRPVTPEGVFSRTWLPVSPDGAFVIATRPNGVSALYPAAGGKPLPIPGLEKGEIPIRWTGDGRSLFAERPFELPLRISRIDLATGRRTLWREVIPLDPAGVVPLHGLLVNRDGEAYVYNLNRLLSHLFYVKGLK